VRRTAGKLQGVSWLASLAPPPGLRPYSPVPLPLHGGEVLGKSSSVPPVAAAPRGGHPTGLVGFLPQLAGGVSRSAQGARAVPAAGATRWFSGSLRSRPLPAFGRTPPFRCRSTGETSDWPLWISPPACWGSGTKCRGGAVRRTARELQ